MPSRGVFSIAGLLLIGGSLVCRGAHAEAVPGRPSPVSWLAARPELTPFARIAVTAEADEDPDAALAPVRDEVAHVLAAAGHDVATLEAKNVGNREELVAACRGFDALAVVRISTAGDAPTLTLTLYDPRGEAVAALEGPGLSRAAAALRRGLDPSRLRGASLYEAMGRPDLAARYRHRRTAKIVLMSVGGGILGAGLLLAVADVFATATTNIVQTVPCLAMDASNGQTCQQAQTSDWPFLVVGVGAAALLGGAVFPADPLSGAQRRALLGDGAEPPAEPEPARPSKTSLGGFQVSAVPAARGEGGSLILGGRFEIRVARFRLTAS